MIVASSFFDSCLLPSSADMRVMHLRSRQPQSRLQIRKVTNLGGEFQARQSLAEVCLQRADHHKHQRFRIAPKRVLQEIRQLSGKVSANVPQHPS